MARKITRFDCSGCSKAREGAWMHWDAHQEVMSELDSAHRKVVSELNANHQRVIDDVVADHRKLVNEIGALKKAAAREAKQAKEAAKLTKSQGELAELRAREAWTLQNENRELKTMLRRLLGGDE